MVIVLPFTVWAILLFSDFGSGKTLANLGEPIYFAALVPVVAGLRVAIGSRVSETFSAASLLVVMCFAAGGVFFLVPPLPE